MEIIDTPPGGWIMTTAEELNRQTAPPKPEKEIRWACIIHKRGRFHAELIEIEWPHGDGPPKNGRNWRVVGGSYQAFTVVPGQVFTTRNAALAALVDALPPPEKG